MIFEILEYISGRFQYLFMKSVFVASFYRVERRQKFDYKLSTYPGNQARSLDFGIFEDICFGTTLLPIICMRKFSTVYVPLRTIKDFLMAVTITSKNSITQTKSSRKLAKFAPWSGPSKMQISVLLIRKTWNLVRLDINAITSPGIFSEVTWPSLHFMDHSVLYGLALCGISQIVL